MNRVSCIAAIMTASAYGLTGCARTTSTTDDTSWRIVSEKKAQSARISARNYLNVLAGGKFYQLEEERVTPEGHSFLFRDTQYDGPGNWCEVYTDNSGNVRGFIGGL
jgi:hypothetical protein